MKEKLLKRFPSSEVDVKKLQSDNRLMDQLLSLLAHDFSGTARNLQWIVDSLERGALAPETLQALLPELKSVTHTVTQSTEDMLEWVKSRRTDYRPMLTEIEVHGLLVDIQRWFMPAATHKGVDILINAARELVIRSDRTALTFVLKRIVDNAIKYSFKGSTIDIMARALPHEQLSICIVDHGMGMDLNVQANLFTLGGARYTGTDGEKGAGLSLVVVQQLAEWLGIALHTNSNPKNGTKIDLIIPAN